ncbi:NitT/TauT family transport system permease protein [Geosporobacter subterraneus DSM 17957]|uniref:NitT/TauT family transport system permease protein n=1 Tax=Geosporobacter subterraneus DSM 17957 TaxID=1121919 RepID=A0A1M6I0Z1_9FIRM|nr:ABC transporter permease subunit [Geosporobacter subterraneus]SHJ28091.1 NitT/TauT family transport system permease protein [Geosporobacter subterraneus DSM 17957]
MKDSTIKNNRKPLNKLFIFLFWVAMWQGMYFIIGRDIYVPSPFSVLMTLKELLFLPIFWRAISYSIYRVLAGLFLSIILGVSIGIISSMNDYVYQLINPLMAAIKSTPVLSFIIIALIWFSSSNVPIFICFLMCFPIIWTNVVAGVRNVDRKLLQMAQIYDVRKLTTLKKIYLPSISPYLSAACITSLGLGWRVSVAAEVLSHPRNAIGSHLYSAKVYLDSSELFAWTVVVILLSLLFESIFARLIRKVTMRKPSAINNE